MQPTQAWREQAERPAVPWHPLQARWWLRQQPPSLPEPLSTCLEQKDADQRPQHQASPPLVQQLRLERALQPRERQQELILQRL